MDELRKFVRRELLTVANTSDPELIQQIKSYVDAIINSRKNMELFLSAFTTQNWARKNGEEKHLETLEFLGDQTLRVPIAEYVLSEIKRNNLVVTPGLFTKVKNFFESGETLAVLATRRGFDDIIKKVGNFLSPEEEGRNGEKKYFRKTIEDMFEAFMGAMFLAIKNVAGNIGDAYTFNHTYFSIILQENRTITPVDSNFLVRVDSYNQLKDHMETHLKVRNSDGTVSRTFMLDSKSSSDKGKIVKVGDMYYYSIVFFRLRPPDFKISDSATSSIVFFVETPTEQDYELIKWPMALTILNKLNMDDDGNPRSPVNQIIYLNSRNRIRIDAKDVQRTRFDIVPAVMQSGITPIEQVFDSNNQPLMEAGKREYRPFGDRQRSTRGSSRGRGGSEFSSRGRGSTRGSFGFSNRGASTSSKRTFAKNLDIVEDE